MSKKKLIILISSVAVVLAVSTPFLVKYIKAEQLRLEIEREYKELLETGDSFYEETYINDIDVAGLTKEAAFDKVSKDFLGKSILIKTPFNKEGEVFSYEKLNVDFSNLEKFVDEAFQNRSLSLEEFQKGRTPEYLYYNPAQDINFEKSDLGSLEMFSEKNRTEPKDATLEIDRQNGTAEIVPEVYGNVLSEGVFNNKLKKAIEESAEEVVLETSDYMQPAVFATDEELVAKKDRLALMLNKEIDITLCGQTVDIKTSKAREFIDPEAEDFINEEEIAKYAKSLANKYNTYGIDRNFLTSTGENIVVSGGDYGWRLDTEAISESIKEALLDESETVSLEGAYKNKGQRLPKDELTGTYVEVCLRDQKIWMYVNGVRIVEDDCTTGMVGDPECHTNCGVFSLTYKTTDRVLKGPTWEDFVFYWMPFDRSIGLHDATWRTDEEFGGNNRFGNGSHGCINLRLDTARTVYENIQADTPIIVWE